MTREWLALRPPVWSSGQSSWLQIRRPGFDSWHYQKKESSGSGTGSTQPREYN
jgi:ribosomal protein L37E